MSRHIADLKASREFNLITADIVLLCGEVSHQRSDGTRTREIAWWYGDDDICPTCLRIDDSNTPDAEVTHE